LNSSEAGKSVPSVLIVGTGPAGLFAACELVRHGVVPRIVERREAPHHETRGTALQPAVLESIERAGLVEPFLRNSVHIRQVQLIGPGLAEIAATSFSDTRRLRRGCLVASTNRPARCQLAGLVRRIHHSGAGRRAAADMRLR
jgi:2-polyprenyl-6-methoxyphenol hydroxylase-like FAD-dependent oxidoreductase